MRLPAQIRPAAPEDVPAMLHLVRELALYEREPDAVKATAQDFLRYGFGLDGEEKRFECLLAVLDGRPVGLALYFHNYSTWTGKPGIHLEDLFVLPEVRGQGIGLALIRSVARAAVAKDYPRLQWDVLEWNEPAVEFYKELGAKTQTDWRTMRVEGAALMAMAQAESEGQALARLAEALSSKDG